MLPNFEHVHFMVLSSFLSVFRCIICPTLANVEKATEMQKVSFSFHDIIPTFILQRTAHGVYISYYISRVKISKPFERQSKLKRNCSSELIQCLSG